MNGVHVLDVWIVNMKARDPDVDLYEAFGERLGLDKEEAKLRLYEIVWNKSELTYEMCAQLGHPLGPVWYTHSAATEPDMHCKYCGKEMG